MLNGWRIKRAGTGDCRRSVTGTTIALAWTPPAGTVAITDRTIAEDRTIAGGAITDRTIARIKEIIGTISAEDAQSAVTLVEPVSLSRH
jgi:hypothetical protein